MKTHIRNESLTHFRPGLSLGLSTNHCSAELSRLHVLQDAKDDKLHKTQIQDLLSRYSVTAFTEEGCLLSRYIIYYNYKVFGRARLKLAAAERWRTRGQAAKR